MFVVLAASLTFDHLRHKEDKAISLKQAAIESCMWIALAVGFNVYIYFSMGLDASMNFFSGYLLEKSLSVDNLFVMMAIFSSFVIPQRYRHRILYRGILGAIVLRMCFIFAGAWLMSLWPVVLVIFGLIVIWSAIKMLKELMSDGWEQDEVDYSKGKIATFLKKILPVYPKLDWHKFFVRENWKLFMTALFLTLVVIEIADVMFAFDSIPAVLAITSDKFILFSSNIFAILGLRSLYFILEAVGNQVKYLSHAVIIILFFIWAKMISGIFGFHIPTYMSLIVIGFCLSWGIAYSMVKK